MKKIVFNEKIEGWHKYFGIIYACYASFGGTLLILLLYTMFGNSINYFFLNPVTNIILPLVVFLIFIPIVFKPLKQQKAKKIIIWTVIILVLKFVAKIFFRFLENNLIVFLGHEGLKNFNSEHLSNKLTDQNIWIQIFGILSVCLIGPFVEEVTYRICLFTTLRKKIGISAHLITAFLFGFQHIAMAVLLYNRPLECLYIFSYMGGSLVSSIVYEKIKTPVPGIISHMAGNLINIL
jgi:membrane protease YdiL (CAAX protease family)